MGKKISTPKELSQAFGARTNDLQYFFASRISKDDALEHINYYRDGLPPTAIKSVWLDASIIDFIVRHYSNLRINGVRVYMARYKDGVVPVTTNPGLKDKETVILAATADAFSDDPMDIEEGYFNYGRPCPPTCPNGDVGDQ